LLAAPIAACDDGNGLRKTGYLEMDLIQVSPQLGGRLETVNFAEGDSVTAGAVLFTLDSGSERATLDRARAQMSRAHSVAANMGKGSRPEEIASLQAQRQEAKASVDVAKRNLDRGHSLTKTNAMSPQRLDDLLLTYQTSTARLSDIESRIATAKLPARRDEISAAEADVAASEAELRQVEWSLAQKTVNAPRGGIVHELSYKVGEIVPASRPVMALVIPETLRVRVFLGAADLNRIALGRDVTVKIAGCGPTAGTVVHVATKPEYTPPVLFGQGARDKLAYLVEARLTPPDGCTANPGMPADVEIPERAGE
jgi:HlyD family secretion protein